MPVDAVKRWLKRIVSALPASPKRASRSRAHTHAERENYRPERHYMRGPGPMYQQRRAERGEQNGSIEH